MGKAKIYFAIFIIFLLNFKLTTYSYAVDSVTHTIIGATTAGLFTDKKEEAFAVGIISHAVFDILPHNDLSNDDPQTIIKALFGFIVLKKLYKSYKKKEKFDLILYGAIGGYIPDLEIALNTKKKIFPTHNGSWNQGESYNKNLETGIVILIDISSLKLIKDFFN